MSGGTLFTRFRAYAPYLFEFSVPRLFAAVLGAISSCESLWLRVLRLV